MSTYLLSKRGFDGERSGACVCVPLKRVPSGSLPFFDVGAIYDSTTLHNILLSTRVPRDSSLLCDRTRPRPGIYTYIYTLRVDVVRSMFRQHERPPPPTEIEDEKKKTSSSSSSSFFWYTPTKSFLLSHVSLFKVFSYSSGVFVLICSACNPFSLNSSSRSAYTCRCLATCFMP